MPYNPDDDKLTGCKLSAASDGKTITVSHGAAYVPNTGRMLFQNDMSTTVTAVNAWQHFYLGIDANNVPVFEASTVAPDDPYQGTARIKVGDATRRYVGSIYFGSDGKCMPFLHTQVGEQGNRIDFTPANGMAASAAALLNLGILQSAKIISVASFVPVTCRVVHVQAVNTASAAMAYLSNPDFGAVSSTNFLRTVPPNNSDEMELLVSAAQEISYMMGGTLPITVGGLTLRVHGYVFDR